MRRWSPCAGKHCCDSYLTVVRRLSNVIINSPRQHRQHHHHSPRPIRIIRHTTCNRTFVFERTRRVFTQLLSYSLLCCLCFLISERPRSTLDLLLLTGRISRPASQVLRNHEKPATCSRFLLESKLRPTSMLRRSYENNVEPFGRINAGPPSKLSGFKAENTFSNSHAATSVPICHYHLHGLNFLTAEALSLRPPTGAPCVPPPPSAPVPLPDGPEALPTWAARLRAFGANPSSSVTNQRSLNPGKQST